VAQLPEEVLPAGGDQVPVVAFGVQGGGSIELTSQVRSLDEDDHRRRELPRVAGAA
jgi:hypothetical protein